MAQASGRFKILCVDTKELVFSLSQYFETKHWRLLIQLYINSDLPKKCYVCKTNISPYYFHYKTKIRLGKERLTDIMPICLSCYESCREDKARRNGKKKFERFLLHDFGFNLNNFTMDEKNWLLSIHPHKRSHILSTFYNKRAGQYKPSSNWINQQVKYTCKWIHKIEKELRISLFQDV